MADPTHQRPWYLWSTLTNHCPRCREGKIFKSDKAYNLKENMKMHAHCPVCGQPTDLEVGFYYGTSYVSYALSIAFLTATFVAWKVLIGMTFDIDDYRIFYWMGVSFVLLFLIQPPLMRFSRSLWLSWFVKYDPDWRQHPLTTPPERIVPEHMNNW